MATILNQFETTTGQSVYKKIDTQGRVYFHAEGEGRINQNTYAGKARHKVEPGPDREPPGVTPPRRPFDREDKTEDVGPRYSRKVVWEKDEGGVSIYDYPADERIRQLSRLTRQNDGFDLINWVLTYEVEREDGEILEDKVRTTKFHQPEVPALRQDFERIIDDLRHAADTYNNVYVFTTSMTARNENQ